MKHTRKILAALIIVMTLLVTLAVAAIPASAATGETITVYFQNNWLWSDVHVYYWGSTTHSNPNWNGNSMTKVGHDGTYDIYSAEIPSDITGLVFNGGGEQSIDITSGWFDGACYYMSYTNYEKQALNFAHDSHTYNNCVCSFCGDNIAVASLGDTNYATLADAVAAAQEGDEVVLLADVEESIATINNVILTTNVVNGVTFTNLYDSYLYFDNVTVREGVTVVSPLVFSSEGVNTIEGALEVGKTYYHGYGAKTIVQNGGKIKVSGNTILRYNSVAEAGIYVYGDNDASTVEYDCDGYVGAYSGSFYAKDANVEVGYILLTNNTDGSNYAAINMELDNSTVNVVGAANTSDRINMNGRVFLTLENGSSIADVRDMDIASGTQLTLTVDENSSISVQYPNIAEDVPFEKVDNGDGTYGIEYNPTLSGTGTEADPFVISSLDELKLFRDMVNGGTTFDNQFVVLAADINLGGESWEPIGNSSNKFLGTFDGQDNTISNLVVDIESNNAGLFGYASVIKNVKLVNAKVSGFVCVGALVGELENSVGTLENCHLSGLIQITGENSVGGLAGKGYANIRNCSVIGDGTSTSFVLGVNNGHEEGDNVGGIIGHLGEGNTLGVANSTVKNIKIAGTRKVGGIVGTTARANDYVGNSVDGLVIESTATAEYADDNASTTTIGGIIGNYFGSATSGGILQDSTVSNVEFILGNAKSAGALAGGDRVNNGGAPVGVEATGSTVTNVTGATNEYLLPVYAAQIGDVKYESLADAIDAAVNGDTITLLADVADVDATITKNITLDLGGKTITDAYIQLSADVKLQNGSIKNVNESYPLVVNKGTLTVENVAIEASKSDRAIWLRNSGTVLNFNSGSILATKGENNTKSTIYGVWVSEGATANINGGTIEVDAGANATAVAIFGNYVNTVNINGGKISTSGKTYSYAVYTYGDVTVTGGEIVTNEKSYGYSSGITYGKNYAINTKGNVTISGGKFTTNGPSGYLVNAGGSNQNVTISNVEFTNVLSEADKTAGGHSAPNLIYGSSVTATITGGDFNGVSAQLIKGTGSTLAVSGGTFDVAINEDLIAEGFEITANADGSYGVAVDPAYGKVAKIGDTYYATLADALAAAKTMSGDVTVEILGKATLNSALSGSFDSITFVGKDTDAEIYLDVQGYITATGKKVAFEDLILSKSAGGFITNAGFMNVAFGIYDVTEVTYTNCTFANGAYASSGNVTYTGCTFQKSHDKYGLWAYGDVNVTVSGCTFDNDRGIKMYAEDKQKTTELTVENTDFSKLTGKPAIVLTYGESVTLADNNTYSSTGVFELDLDGAPNGTVVDAPASITCKNDNGVCGVLVDGKIYTTVADAAAVATSGSTVTLLHNSTETVKLAEGVTLDKNGYTADGVSIMVAVAAIGETRYGTLQEALNAAAAGTGNVTVEILVDIDLTNVDWTPVTVSAPGYPVVTVNGNNKTITGLNDMLFAGTWAGGSGLIINDLTIANSTIVNDENDSKGTVGVGAFVGFPQASSIITLNNCHLVDSTVKGGHWTGGLIGYAAGYAGTDGPVFMNLTIKDCSVTGSTITGKGSVGGIIGHATGNAWTAVAIETTTVSGNTVTSTGSSTNKAGAVIGTIGAAGQATTVNGVEKTGGVSVSATVSGNTVTSNGTTITTIYGRQGSGTGKLAIAGGSYDSNPIEENVSYAAPVAGYMIVENTDGSFGLAVDPAYGKAAMIGDTYYESLAEAVAAAQACDEIVLLADAAEDVTLPAGVIFNGNGKQVGAITAAGEITFKGHTKATNFSVAQTNLVINIIEGACLEITGTDRLVIGHGCTFNITGTITDAKTANVADLTPSLIMPGASFTGAGVTFNVTNAYIKAPSSYCSSSKSASGTFDFNIINSIVETAGKLAFESQSTAATVNFELKDSVLTTGSHLVFGVSRGEIVIDNSNVNVGTSKQIENQSTMIIKNGSVVNGAVATSSNAKNPGTIIVDNATYSVTGEFSGSDLGTGTIIVKNGAIFSAGSITKANIQIDATGMKEGDEINITADLSKHVGTLEVINNDSLEAKIVDGKIVLSKKPAAKIGETYYATLEEAFKAATEGCVIEILTDVVIDYKWDCRDYATNGSHSMFKESVTINGNGHTIKFTGTINDNNWNTVFRFEENATVNNLTIDISEATGAQRVITAKKSLTVDGLTIIGSAKYGIIFGEGASATDLAATEIVIKNSTLTGTRRAISDNEGGKDVKSIVITGNTLNANVYVSASESIVFNNNTAAGEVDLRSYTAGTALTVEAQGNTLNTEVKNYIFAKEINAQDDFTIERPPFKVATKAELNAALAAAQEGDTILLTADIDYGTDQLKIEKAITLDLGGNTLTTRNAYGGMSVKNNPTIKNGTIVHASNTAAIKVWNAVAFEDLVIDVQGKGDANKTIGGIVLQSGSTTRVGSIKNVTIKGAALTNGIETYNCGDATENVIGSMENVTINANGTGMLISAPCGTATGCTISGGTNAIELWIKGTYSASLELVDCDVEGGIFAHDEFSSNPDIVNNGSLNLTVDAATTGADDVTLTLARAENVEGLLKDIKDNAQAKVNNTYYATLADALTAAQVGDTITLLVDLTLDSTLTIEKAITLDLGGKTVTGADGAIVINAKAALTIKNGTILGNKSGTSSGLIDIYADINLDGVTLETSKINALRFKAGDCTATLTDCTVTGAFKGYGGSVWKIVSGTYKAASTAINDQLNGTASISGGTFHYAIEAVDCAPGYAVVDNGDGTYGVKYAPVAFVDTNNNGTLDDGEVIYGSLEAIFETYKTGDVYIVITADTSIATQVDTDADAKYYLNTNVAAGVTVEFAYADNWNYIQKMYVGKNVTLKAPYLCVWTDLDVYGTIITDYLYIQGGDVLVAEGAEVTANTGDATVQVKGGALLTVNGAVNTSTLNVWAGESKLVVNGANAKVDASWIDIWDGTPSVSVEDGATLEVDSIKASRGGEIAVSDATINAGKVILGHNGNSVGKLVESGNSAINGEIQLTVTGSTIESDGGLDNITSTVEGYVVIFENGEYKLTPAVAKIGDVEYGRLADACAAAQAGETVTLLMNIELDAPITVKKNITLDGNGYTITQSSECNNNIALIYFEGSADNVLDVNVNNVTFDGLKVGAAIRTLYANINIDNCVFQNCDHTVGQGIVRLTYGTAKITNSKFLNNNCSMGISFNWDGNGLDTDTLTVDNCVFENNTANKTALIYYVKGVGCTITGSEFVDNTVNCNANGATIYLGFQENCTITGCLFKNNNVIEATASQRVAGAIFAGYQATITGNVFDGNTASNVNGDTLGQVCVSTYYEEGEINISDNYWNGAPDAGSDYFVQHQTGSGKLVLDSYYSAYTLDENGNAVLAESDLVKAEYVARIGKYYYASFAEAFAAAKDGDVIALLSDVSSDEVIVLDKAISIFADGKTITAAIKVSANVTIDNANIIGVAGHKAVITVTSNAQLTVQGGKITALQAISARSGAVASTEDQYIILADNTNGALAHLDTELSFGSKRIFSGDANTITVLVREEYKDDLVTRGFVTSEVDGNGMITIEQKLPYYIGENGNWYFNDEDTGRQAVATDGETPYIKDGNWWIGETDLGVRAEAVDGTTPHIGDNGNWFIGETDTGKPARGQNGETPYIGDNGNWWIGTTDTGKPARGEAGTNGTNGETPYIKDGNWWIGNDDTGVVAAGKDGTTPHIGENGNWFIGNEDTGIPAKGQDGAAGDTPFIGENGNWWVGDKDTEVSAKGDNGETPTFKIEGGKLWAKFPSDADWTDLGTVVGSDGVDGADGKTPYVGDNGNWFINGIDTNTPAIAQDGKTPHIGENGNWFLGTTDTGVAAKAKDGTTPHIGDNGNWFIGTTDTGVAAKGQDGKTPAFKLEDGHLFVSFGDDAWEDLGKVVGDNGTTPHIGENGNWFIGETDTGIPAKGQDGASGLTPYIGENGNWWIGETDTGVSANAGNAGGAASENSQKIILICIAIATLCLITTIVAVATRKSRSRWWILT